MSYMGRETQNFCYENGNGVIKMVNRYSKHKSNGLVYMINEWIKI